MNQRQKWDRLYASYGGIEGAVRGYLERTHRIVHIAAEVGLSRQSICSHFAQFLGKPLSEIPHPKTPSRLPLQLLINKCTSAAENGNQYALSLSRLCRDILSEPDEFFGIVSTDYRRIYGKCANQNKDLRLYAIKPSVRPPSGHLYIRSDITRRMKEVDFVVFAAASNEIDGWFLFQSCDLPDITTISLRIGSDISKYRPMYRRRLPWNDGNKEPRSIAPPV